ncbi:hypothetical protein [Streptomyces agglomeratus]|uniref:hypothetical protein n=1 Tax=Streptomyces agglomeratus TaxID=285458 RepID=UPI001428A293|nr:hypothetical protein [Streptomyces agglomeratus]
MAATGLVALMIGEAVTHGRRREFQMITPTLSCWCWLSAVVAQGFGPHSFTP